jgi:FkbM family methyltransferase
VKGAPDEARSLRTRGVAYAGRAARALNRRPHLPERATAATRLLGRSLARAGSQRYVDEHGHVVLADLSDYMARNGFLGAHSPRLIRFVRSHLASGDWAIDVGANTGLFTSAMAAAVGAAGAVWAFEPLPGNVERLEALKGDNDLAQLTIVPVALSATAGVARLRLPANQHSSGFGSFVATWEREGELEVPTVPLDAVVDERGPDRPLRLLKIDVEGFEHEVLVGAEATLRRHRPLVLCELHDPLLRAAGGSAERLVARFAAYGYRPAEPFALPRTSLTGFIGDVLLVPDPPPDRPPTSA